MNKNILIMGVVIVAVIAGGVVLWQQKSVTEVMVKDNGNGNGNVKVEASVSDDKMMQKEASRYQDYSPDAFNEVSDKKRVLYFHADWCPVCRPLDAGALGLART